MWYMIVSVKPHHWRIYTSNREVNLICIGISCLKTAEADLIAGGYKYKSLGRYISFD